MLLLQIESQPKKNYKKNWGGEQKYEKTKGSLKFFFSLCSLFLLLPASYSDTISAYVFLPFN